MVWWASAIITVQDGAMEGSSLPSPTGGLGRSSTITVYAPGVLNFVILLLRILLKHFYALSSFEQKIFYGILALTLQAR